MEAIQVFKDEFSNLENRNAEYSKLLGTFIEKEGLTAAGNAAKFIDNMKPVKLYVGWDGKVYPKIRLEKINIE